jgi:hypothetical protein
MSKSHEIGWQVADYVIDQIITGRFILSPRNSVTKYPLLPRNTLTPVPRNNVARYIFMSPHRPGEAVHQKSRKLIPRAGARSLVNG